ncbi:MAG: amidohydrolase family protein [Armatimonadetes bacterium]|nr:amidohydrolase family protein [Armatimonadota bacterium]
MKIRGRIVGAAHRSELTIESGKIREIRPVADSSPSEEQGPSWIAPGFIDVQVNGWGGKNINRPEVTAQDVTDIVGMLGEYGVTMLCPTVTTQSRDSIRKSMTAIRQACESSEAVSYACPAIHLEGPYISPEDGPRGAHPLEHVRPPDTEEFRVFQEAAGGRIGIVTLAPETGGAIPFIEELRSTGIIPAIGHANSTREDIRAAIGAGACLSTHLGNGSHAKVDRLRNYIWEQLAADELYASLIADGHHLPPAALKCMIRGKGIERSILTTDAIGLAGKPPGIYRDWEVAEVELTEEGAARLAGTPYLAGAVMPMTRLIENTVRFAGVSLREAIDMATRNPARLLGLEEHAGSVEVGKDASLVLFLWDDQQAKMEVVQALSRGQVVYSN